MTETVIFKGYDRIRLNKKGRKIVMDLEKITERAKEILGLIDKEKYPYTHELFYGFAEGGWYDLLDLLNDIMVCDKNLPIEPNAASFIKELLLYKIEKENDDNAMCNLGALYYDGRIGEQSYVKAIYYYEMSAKLGNRQAQQNLGYCYFYGRDGQPDYKKAYHYFIKGALGNDVVSLYKIGDMYKYGYYVEKDEKEAFCIYEQCERSLTEQQEKDFGSDVYYSNLGYVTISPLTPAVTNTKVLEKFKDIKF